MTTLNESMKTAVLSTELVEARKLVDQYNASAKFRSLLPEEKACLTTARQLKKGRRVIDLYRVFKAVSSDAKGRPALALANASWKWCYYVRERDTARFYKENRKYDKSMKHCYRVPGTMMAGPIPEMYKTISGKAVVPTIPPNLRPEGPIDQYHILFEASWEDVPTDPILLKNIPGTNNLFVVLAHWDLTEIERAVLAGRFNVQ